MIDNEIEGIDFKTDTIFKISGKRFTIKASKKFIQDESTDHNAIRFAIIIMHDDTSSEIVSLIPNLPYSFSITKFPIMDSSDKDFNTKNTLITALDPSIIKSIVEALIESNWWCDHKNSYKEL